LGASGFLAAMPAGHALAERESVHWLDLKEEKNLLSRRESGP
jgi:hypothetical protein